MRRSTVVQKQKKRERDETHKLRHMVRFIEQEGREKAEEVDCRTEEEFNILKGKIIQEERIKIMNEYENKEIRCKQQIAVSAGKFMQDQRALIVQAKIKVFDEILADVKYEVFTDMESSKRRWNTLQRLIMESLFKLLEQEVIITCREIDEPLIRKAIPDIETVFENATNLKIKINIDENYLSCCMILPGVIIRKPNGKITISNTLESRLDQIMKSSLPVMNHLFFGTSKLKD